MYVSQQQKELQITAIIEVQKEKQNKQKIQIDSNI